MPLPRRRRASPRSRSRAPPPRRVVAQVARVAPTSMPVLFTGETGTGKEVMARLTHAWSPRHAEAVRADQLRGDSQRADGGRALRLRARRVLRRGPALRRPADGRRGRHGLPRRDRRHAARDAGEAAARARGSRGEPARRERLARGRLPAARGDQPRPRGRSSRTGAVRRGSLRAARDRHDSPGAAARAARGPAGAGRALHAALRPRAAAARRSPRFAPTRCARSRRIRGPATSASCAT